MSEEWLISLMSLLWLDTDDTDVTDSWTGITEQVSH